jgi:hypothetical protein
VTYRFKGEILTSREETEEYLMHGYARQGDRMIIKCEKHGEVEGQSSLNNDLFCPECSKEATKTWAERAAQRTVHTDKAKPGTEFNGTTILTADGAILGSIQTFTPTSEDREKLLKAGKIYELSEPRGPYSMGCAVQGHIPCQSPCEPGQRAEGTEPEVKKEPSQYEQFLEDLKKADLIESYRMTGENTAEITMKYAVNWLNKLGWSRIDSK